jgi:RHS repeat-associated protein
MTTMPATSSPLHFLRSFALIVIGLISVGGIAQAQQNTTTHYAYDAMGNLTTVTDPLGHVTQYSYDALDMRITGTDANLGLTKLTYNGQDNLTGVADPRNLSTTYQLDGLGNQTKLTSPDTGITQQLFDAAGNLISSTNAKAQITTYSYDTLNRLKQINYADSQTVILTYDQGTNAIGRLNQFTDSSGTTNYSYDQYGKITQEQRSIAGTNYVTSYTYDSAGQLATMTYPSGRQLVYLRDTLGRVQQIVSIYNNTSVTLIRNVQYTPSGIVQSYINGTGNTVSTITDLDGRTTSYSINQQSRQLTYDAASRLTQQTDPAQTVTYAYDPLNRLTQTTNPTTSTSYHYDAVGNRTTKTIGGTNTQYTYSTTSNRLTKISGSPAKTITSDANGSITNNGTNQFTYDARERLVSAQTSIGTVQYKYNALGQRVSKTTPTSTTVFHYDRSGQLIGEKNGTNTIDYIYLNTIPVAIGKSSTPQLYYINTDQLNTPRVITNETGTTLWQWDGEAFGNTPPNENPSGAGNFTFNLRFPGQHFDAETNLNQNYFRDYDPATGRYIESDPIGLMGGLNTFLYVDSNPLGKVDPTGEFAIALPLIPSIIEAASYMGSAAVVAYAAQQMTKNQCDDAELCLKAKNEAQSRYQKLVNKRIPQYLGGGTDGPDANHYESILQLQQSLKDAIRRVKLYCKPLPPEIMEWERAANQFVPPQH